MPKPLLPAPTMGGTGRGGGCRTWTETAESHRPAAETPECPPGKAEDEERGGGGGRVAELRDPRVRVPAPPWPPAAPLHPRGDPRGCHPWNGWRVLRPMVHADLGLHKPMCNVSSPKPPCNSSSPKPPAIAPQPSLGNGLPPTPRTPCSASRSLPPRAARIERRNEAEAVRGRPPCLQPPPVLSPPAWRGLLVVSPCRRSPGPRQLLVGLLQLDEASLGLFGPVPVVVRVPNLYQLPVAPVHVFGGGAGREAQDLGTRRMRWGGLWGPCWPPPRAMHGAACAFSSWKGPQKGCFPPPQHENSQIPWILPAQRPTAASPLQPGYPALHPAPHTPAAAARSSC